MPNCTRCGTDNDVSAQFCKNCGNQLNAGGYPPPPPQGQYPPPPPPGQYPPPNQQGYYPPPPGYGQQTESGMQQNIAGLLCYILGWLTGLIFFFIDKRPFVRFHAMQSIITFGALTVIHIMLSIIFTSMFSWRLFALWSTISSLLGLLQLVLWIFLMVKAYQNQWYKLPLVGDIAMSKSQQM